MILSQAVTSVFPSSIFYKVSQAQTIDQCYQKKKINLTPWLLIKLPQLWLSFLLQFHQSESTNFMEPLTVEIAKCNLVLFTWKLWADRYPGERELSSWLMFSMLVSRVRQQVGFIICYGPQQAITQPWNSTSAANTHFSMTKSALCLLLETEASVSST